MSRCCKKDSTLNANINDIHERRLQRILYTPVNIKKEILLISEND